MDTNSIIAASGKSSLLDVLNDYMGQQSGGATIDTNDPTVKYLLDNKWLDTSSGSLTYGSALNDKATAFQKANPGATFGSPYQTQGNSSYQGTGGGTDPILGRYMTGGQWTKPASSLWDMVPSAIGMAMGAGMSALLPGIGAGMMSINPYSAIKAIGGVSDMFGGNTSATPSSQSPTGASSTTIPDVTPASATPTTPDVTPQAGGTGAGNLPDWVQQLLKTGQQGT